MKAFFLLLLLCLGAMIQIAASNPTSATPTPTTSQSSQMFHGPFTWSILLLTGVLAYLLQLH